MQPPTSQPPKAHPVEIIYDLLASTGIDTMEIYYWFIEFYLKVGQPLGSLHNGQKTPEDLRYYARVWRWSRLLGDGDGRDAGLGLISIEGRDKIITLTNRGQRFLRDLEGITHILY